MRAAHRLLSPSPTRTLRTLQARGVHFNSSAFAPLASVQSSEYAQTHTTSDVINFGLGQPSASLLPLEMLRRAAEHRFQPGQDRALLQYGSARGYRGFREAIAEFLAGKKRHHEENESDCDAGSKIHKSSHMQGHRPARLTQTR